MANAYGTYTLADIAAAVKGCDAKFLSRASQPLSLDDTITRYWDVQQALFERVRKFLDLYGDGDHYLPVGGVAPEVHAITAPAVGQGGVGQSDDPAHGASDTATGIWRIVRNYETPDKPGRVYQDLRHGWITSVVTNNAVTSAAWAEARVFEEQGGNALVNGTTSWRRRVVRVGWHGVAATAAEDVASSLRGLAAAAWNLESLRDGYGAGWHRLSVHQTPADDGSFTVTVLLAQPEAAFDFFTDKGTSRERAGSVLFCPADLAQAYANQWRTHGAATTAGSPPVGGSATISADPDSGLAQVRFDAKAANPTVGAVVVGAKVASSWQVHFIAWNQPAANLAYPNDDPLSFAAGALTALGLTGKVTPGDVTAGDIANGEWRLGGLDYDQETDRYAWHVTWSDAADVTDGTTVSMPLVYWKRKMWDNENLIWVPQIKVCAYDQIYKLCTTFNDALTWRDASTVGGSPLPRRVGNKWLAIKTVWDGGSQVYPNGYWVTDASPDA
ncbi:MAG: hypothetical protein PHR35_12640 [Kiritimatiellae bacterium]|nr:hypothetical protein [Kiritimatiellia bacterium]